MFDVFSVHFNVLLRWWWLFPKMQEFEQEDSMKNSPPKLFYYFSSSVEISPRQLIPLFGPGSVHNGSVN